MILSICVLLFLILSHELDSITGSDSLQMTRPSSLETIFTGPNAKYLTTFDWRLGGSWAFDLQQAKDGSYQTFAKAPGKEDIYAYEHWFFGLKNGVVLEVGSGDGVASSASYLFDKFARWVSINIEPNVSEFEKLKANRPNSFNINAKIVKNGDSSPIVNISGTIQTESVSLSRLMSHLQVRHVDFCVIKTTAADELSILESLDIGYTHVSAFAISTGSSASSCQAISSHLSRFDYDCVSTAGFCMCMSKWYRPSALKNIIV